MEINLEANDLLVFSTAVHAGGGLDATVQGGVWDHVFHVNFERLGTVKRDKTHGDTFFYVTPDNAISEEHVLKLAYPVPPRASLKVVDCCHFDPKHMIDVAKGYVWGVAPCGGPCKFTRVEANVSSRVQVCIWKRP